MSIYCQEVIATSRFCRVWSTSNNSRHVWIVHKGGGGVNFGDDNFAVTRQNDTGSAGLFSCKLITEGA